MLCAHLLSLWGHYSVQLQISSYHFAHRSLKFLPLCVLFQKRSNMLNIFIFHCLLQDCRVVCVSMNLCFQLKFAHIIYANYVITKIIQVDANNVHWDLIDIPFPKSAVKLRVYCEHLNRGKSCCSRSEVDHISKTIQNEVVLLHMIF